MRKINIDGGLSVRSGQVDLLAVTNNMLVNIQHDFGQHSLTSKE